MLSEPPSLLKKEIDVIAEVDRHSPAIRLIPEPASP
jgi:hypothetical protein